MGYPLQRQMLVRERMLSIKGVSSFPLPLCVSDALTELAV